jgi:hypothetical protein
MHYIRSTIKNRRVVVYLKRDVGNQRPAITVRLTQRGIEGSDEQGFDDSGDRR